MSKVLALHGFTRGPQHLAAFGEACERRGWVCVRPSVAPRLLSVLMNDRRHLDRVAQRLVKSGRLVGPVVIVGHSAGAAAGTWMAPRLIDAGVEVRGLVYVDGNDSPNHLIMHAWHAVASLPIRAVMAPPNPCNRNGKLANFLNAQRPGSVEVISGAGHGDIEMSGAAIYRRACGDSSGPTQWKAVQEAVLATVGDLLDS
jgi:pimeloyl-ACP methyl ester carboxylesterase